MILAIPTEKMNGLNSKVFGHFGIAPFYAIYNSDNENLEFMENRHEEHVHGSCQPTGELSAVGVNAIVCSGMGVRAVNRFNELKIKVFFADNEPLVEGIIRKWKNNDLKELSIENACHGHQH